MSTFTPSTVVDMSKERDWPAALGMLDWDNTNIVFTKRTLLEFLKYAGVTVDPNFNNIQKLPRYVQFGKLSGDLSLSQSESDIPTATSAAPSAIPASDFKPTRRVREAPGGSHTNIFQNDDDDDDALAGAPPKASATTTAAEPAAAEASAEAPTDNSSQMKSRRTTSSVARLWDAPEEPAFKPTRRVREMPGGKDSISGLF